MFVQPCVDAKMFSTDCCLGLKLMLLPNPLVFDCRKRILRLGIDYIDLCLQFTFPEQKYAQNYAVPIGFEPSKRN